MGFLGKLFGGDDRRSTGAGPFEPSDAKQSSEEYLFSLEGEIMGKEDDALTSAEKVFVCVWELEAEVNNGGFSQFYFNSSGDMATEVPGALRSIGAEHTATIVDRANGLFGPEGPPADRTTRQERLDSLGESMEDELEALDQAFLEYRDNLSQLLADYMKVAGGGV